MRLRATANRPDPQHVTWLGKWGDPFTGFTFDMFRDPAFATEADARAAWPSVRRHVWMATHRFSIPAAAHHFDGLTHDGCHETRWSWNHVHFPLDVCLKALAADRAHLAAFRAADPAGAASIADLLAELEADFTTVEAAAHALAACPETTCFRPYPTQLSTAQRYGGPNGGAE